MSHVAHTETKDGIRIDIVLDDIGDTDSPLAYNDGAAIIMAVLHCRYENPADNLPAIFDSAGNSFDFDSVEGIAHFEAEMEAAGDKAEYEVFPLFLYDHSGTSYRVSRGGNPFSCPWDSGRVGILALKRLVEFPDPFKAAQSICEEYTSWANGEIYGFRLIDNDSEKQLDSCWGFIGEPEGYVLDQARDSAKYYIGQKELARVAQLAEDAHTLEESRPDMYGSAR
jgi:hypothetical protein